MVPETPESIVFDRQDNAFVTMAFTGEIRKIAPDLNQSTVTFMPLGAPCGMVVTVALGLAIDRHDQLYVAVTACDPSNSGIWKVDTDDGSIELLANAPSFVVWNGIDVHEGFIYAADTFGGLIWRIPATGGSPEIWADDPLLKIAPTSPFPGPNGVQFFRGDIYVANSSTGDILEIPINPDGSAGQATVFGSVFPLGCDEFTFDVLGRLYCTTDPFNTLARISPDGTVEILLGPADLLDGPTSVAFGRKGTNKKNLYITNAAFPVFTTTFRPSLMRLRIEVPGAPDEY
jgi:sugar lactone lactonase YvrE